MKAVIAGGIVSIGLSTAAQANERVMFVSGDGLNVRYCAASNCCIADRLKLNDAVTIMEEKDGWARISVFHNVKIKSQSCEKPKADEIAHWVSRDFLTEQLPDGTDPNAWFGDLSDRRIRGIPKVGDYGLTRQDLEIIRRYASLLLINGICDVVDTGNKSVSREATYYVACDGETEQRYFTAEDAAL